MIIISWKLRLSAISSVVFVWSFQITQTEIYLLPVDVYYLRFKAFWVLVIDNIFADYRPGRQFLKNSINNQYRESFKSYIVNIYVIYKLQTKVTEEDGRSFKFSRNDDPADSPRKHY